MSIAAADADQRVEQLITLTERLGQLLAAETRAFEARRPQDAAAGGHETARLANIYRHESARIRAEPELISGARADLRRRLTEATRAFNAVLRRHGRALHAAKTVTEGLVQAIAEEVARQRPRASGYGPRARGEGGDGCAIALNRLA